MKKVFY